MPSLGKTLLAIDLLHSVLQGQICLLLQVSLDFLFCIPGKSQESILKVRFQAELETVRVSILSVWFSDLQLKNKDH